MISFCQLDVAITFFGEAAPEITPQTGTFYGIEPYILMVRASTTVAGHSSLFLLSKLLPYPPVYAGMERHRCGLKVANTINYHGHII